MNDNDFDYGGREEYIYQGRIAICSPDTKGEFHQYRLSGLLICPKGQPQITDAGDWENIQCEVIIRPLLRHGVAKIKGTKLDIAAQMLGDLKNWIKRKK